jgi:hypothetical protein
MPEQVEHDCLAKTAMMYRRAYLQLMISSSGEPEIDAGEKGTDIDSYESK